MSVPASMQVEKVLDDLIYRLTNSGATPEVRAALVEARRLKSVTTRWAAIPPPPDARREMLARVMDLISSVNVPEPSPSRPPPPRSGPPVGRSAPPVRSSPPARSAPPDRSSPPGAPTRPPPRRPERDTPVADAALPREALPSSLELEDASAAALSGASAKGAPTTSSEPPRHRSGAGLRPPLPPPAGPRPPSGAMPSARTTAPTRRPPPPPRSTKPPPPTATLPKADELTDRVPDAAPVSGAPRSGSSAKPLSLRPPAPSDRPQTRQTPTHPQPFTRTQSALPSPDRSPAPIRAVATVRGDGVEGLSSSISSSQRRAVEAHRRASEPQRPAPQRTPTVAFAGVREVSASIAKGVSLVRPEATDWQPHPVAVGASVKLLYHDGRTGAYTALVRLAPGGVFPSRRHVALEEMFMVTGSAIVGPVEMRAGEYSRAEEGSVHPPIRSDGGCTFLVCGSENDEMSVGDDA